MVVVLVVVGILVLAAFGALHWYVWRRLVRDTTNAGTLARRAGTTVIVVGPLLFVGSFVAEAAGAPFRLVQAITWPGYMWGALFVYLLLALLVGELVRPMLRRWVARGDTAVVGPITSGETKPADASVRGQAAEPAAETQLGRDTDAPVADQAQTVDVGSGARAESVISLASDPRAAVSAGDAEPGVALASGADTPEAAEYSVPGAGTAAVPDAEPDAALLSGAAGASEAAGGSIPGAGNSAALGSGSAPVPARTSRRVFVSRVIGGAAVLAAATTVGYGTHSVLSGPRVKRLTIPLAKLPRAAHGFRIAVVSDIHLGPILGRGFAETVVDTINDTNPDLIAVVGDLVDGTVEDLRPAVEPLARLRSRHGTYFVTGNHEYISGAEQWVDHVQELGMRLLENSRTELPGFDLAGVNDVRGEDSGHGPDFAAALGDRDRSRTSVLLAHQPVVIDDAVEHGVDLQLSGHTHGGQLWPGNFVAGLANPTVAGLESYGDTQLYVTRGAGAWGPPVRVGAPSDITVVELASRRA